jgi:DNA-binding transcriptional regulator YdaS (Cro superfamily)
MDLGTFTEKLAPEEKERFCRLAGTNRAYLSQLVHGHRMASPKKARALVRASQRMFPSDRSAWLTLSGVRPDLWEKAAAA